MSALWACGERVIRKCAEGLPTRFFLVPFFLFSVLLQISDCLAEPGNKSLFNFGAFQKSYQVSRRAEFGRHSRLSKSYMRTLDSSGAVSWLWDAPTGLGTVEDLSLSGQDRLDVVNAYRGAASVADLRDTMYMDASWDEDFRNSVATRVAAFQTLRTVSDFLLKSSLETLYRDVVRAVREVRRRTSLSVSRDSLGGVRFIQGDPSSDRIARFSLHVSARNGVEPRLRMSDHFVVRYDPLNAGTYFELHYDF